MLTVVTAAVSCGPATEENGNRPTSLTPSEAYPVATLAGQQSYPAPGTPAIGAYPAPGTIGAGAYPAPQSDRTDLGQDQLAGQAQNLAAALQELGGKLLYQSDQSGSFQIYLKQDSPEPTCLTCDLPLGVEGSWSPDGEQIAFVGQGNDPTNLIIRIMNADGSAKRPLMPDQPRLNWRPVWSPDGEQLLFITNRDGNFEIYRANQNGSGLVNLTNNPANDLDPDWSHVTNKIVFASSRQSEYAIYTMDPDGSNVTRLHGETDQVFYPRWSPDGEQIAFVSQSSGSSEIHVMNRDGSDVRQVTDRVGENTMPSWVNNDRLLFSGDFGDETWDLYIINVDGTEMIQLTGQPISQTYSERYPIWRP